MSDRLSTVQWNAIFPTWPLQRDGNSGVDFIDEIERGVEVSTTVYLSAPWHGIADVEDAHLAGETVLDRVGRWVITKNAIIPLGVKYYITINRFDESDWLAHLMEKVWFYDPTDMLDAMELAHARLVPGSTREQQRELTEQQVRVCLDRNIQPFYPSRVIGRHLYLVSRMADQERTGFAQFLSRSGFLAERF